MKIQAITSHNFNKQNSNNKTNVSFEGRNIMGSYFDDEIINYAKEYLDQNGWAKMAAEKLKPQYGDLYLKTPGLFYVTGAVSKTIAETGALIEGGIDKLMNGGKFVKPERQSLKTHAQITRAAFDTATLGVAELVNSVVAAPTAGIKKLIGNNKANKKIEQIAKCINALIQEDSQNRIAELKQGTKDLAIYVKMQEAVQKSFLNQLKWERQAQPAIIPNIIGIETDNFKMADNLIEYAKAESGCNFKLIQAADEKTMFDNLSDTLENAKSLFSKEGQRTLIQVDNFEKIANENISAPRMGALKAVTSELAQQFKSTMIFKTKDMSQIAADIRQGHRIDLKIIAKNIIDALG